MEFVVFVIAFEILDISLSTPTTNVFKASGHAVVGLFCKGTQIVYDSASNLFLGIDWTTWIGNPKNQDMADHFAKSFGSTKLLDCRPECALYVKNSVSMEKGLTCDTRPSGIAFVEKH